VGIVTVTNVHLSLRTPLRVLFGAELVVRVDTKTERDVGEVVDCISEVRVGRLPRSPEGAVAPSRAEQAVRPRTEAKESAAGHVRGDVNARGDLS
jgi:hypothetical protein